MLAVVAGEQGERQGRDLLPPLPGPEHASLVDRFDEERHRESCEGEPPVVLLHEDGQHVTGVPWASPPKLQEVLLSRAPFGVRYHPLQTRCRRGPRDVIDCDSLDSLKKLPSPWRLDLRDEVVDECVLAHPVMHPANGMAALP